MRIPEQNGPAETLTTESAGGRGRALPIVGGAGVGILLITACLYFLRSRDSAETTSRAGQETTVGPLGAADPGRVSSQTDTGQVDSSSSDNQTLLDARMGFATRLTRQERDPEPLPVPSSDLFSLIQYDTALGGMNAYLSQPLDPSRKHAAMVWITGGFPAGGIDESAWEPADPANDQSAKAYRERGMIMMYPTLRGCCANPGFQEGFYGEVEDVIAAGRYLQKLSHVDPNRIYLGGHSTGGTLVLLVAEATDLFSGIVSFGPVEDPFLYGLDTCRHVLTDQKERNLRAPVHFLNLIRSPTIVIEGTQGNIASLYTMQAVDRQQNSSLTFVGLPGLDHFEVLAPVNRILADKIVAHERGQPLTLTADEVLR